MGLRWSGPRFQAGLIFFFDVFRGRGWGEDAVHAAMTAWNRTGFAWWLLGRFHQERLNI